MLPLHGNYRRFKSAPAYIMNGIVHIHDNMESEFRASIGMIDYTTVEKVSDGRFKIQCPDTVIDEIESLDSVYIISRE